MAKGAGDAAGRAEKEAAERRAERGVVGTSNAMTGTRGMSPPKKVSRDAGPRKKTLRVRN
jgi:hypothetical protein